MFEKDFIRCIRPECTNPGFASIGGLCGGCRAASLELITAGSPTPVAENAALREELKKAEQDIAVQKHWLDQNAKTINEQVNRIGELRRCIHTLSKELENA